MKNAHPKISIRAHSPQGERAAARLRRGLTGSFRANRSARRLDRELALALGRWTSPAAHGELDRLRTALAGIDTALVRSIPRLKGFGTLLRQLLTEAGRFGVQKLLSGLFGTESGARSGSSGGGILNVAGNGMDHRRATAGLSGLLGSPWSLILNGAIAAGIALWNHFRQGTERKLRDAIRNAYGVNVREMQVLQRIKAIGEQTFGRGQVPRRLLDTIRLEPVKQLVQSYAESTGQTARGLLTATQLGDPGWAGIDLSGD